MKNAKLARSLAFGLAACLLTPPALALPGFFAGKDGAPRASHSTQIVVMQKGDATVISIMPDYDGPLEPFALFLAVPDDVDATHLSTLPREFMDFVEKNTAPRFHEYWEQDPCDQGPPEQEWERSLTATADSNFLLGFQAPSGKKVAKELSLDVKAKAKEGEYSLSVLDTPIGDWAGKHGYKLPAGAVELAGEYTNAGMKIVAAEVDPNRVELVGGGRAQLSPLRYWTQRPFSKLPIRLGLLSAKGPQELLVYFIHPESRYDVTNYKSQFPPTNIALDFSVKERVGEFYTAVHDMLLAKAPTVWLNEFAWSAEGCGQPCPTGSPLTLAALLSLGGNVFEQWVPEEERNPEPPELTEEEEKALKDEIKALKTRKEKKEKKEEVEAERKLIALRKALVSRHKYVVSRLHHRYEKASLKEDPAFAPVAEPIEGGVAQPKGSPIGAAETQVKPAKQNRYQVRYNNFHPWISQLDCPKPERGRWGKRWRWIRILNKTWIAEDLARVDRKQITPAKVVLEDVPALGLKAAKPGGTAAAGDAGPDAGADAEKAESKCGCRLPGGPASPRLELLSALALMAVGLRRRSR